MKRNILLSLIFLFFSCFGSDADDILIELSIGISTNTTIKKSGLVDSEIEYSLNKYFAVGTLTVDGSLLGTRSQYMKIEFDDAKNGMYFFDLLIEAKIGERISLTFSGYYYVDDSIVGGFKSESAYYIDVKDGMSTDISITSIDIPRTNMTIEIGDSDINTIILKDSQSGIFLRSIKRSPINNMFYQEIPEGTYNIYSLSNMGKSTLLKENISIKGESIEINL